MRLFPAVLLLACACSRPDRTYVLHDVSGGALPFTMFTYAGDKQSQILFAKLLWRADGRVEHQFQYRSLNADGTADTLIFARDVYQVKEDARNVYFSRWAPRHSHRPDSVLLTDTLARIGADLLWTDRMLLGDGAPDDTLVTRLLRFTLAKR